MMFLLAQGNANLFEPVTTVFSRLDTLARPDVLLKGLEQLSLVWAAIFVAAGVLCLFQGYKYYRVVMVIMAVAIGGFVGFSLGRRVDAAYIVAGCLAALLAVCCWPLMKYAVAGMGGLVGAFLGANAWSAITAVANSHGNGARPEAGQGLCWVGALIGLIFCGLLAFLLFNLTIVFFTSVSGATVTVLGVVALLLQVPGWDSPVRSQIATNALVLPLLVIVPALIGSILQQTSPAKAGSAASGGGASGGGVGAKAAKA